MQADLKDAVEQLNTYLTPNCVHTFQFVSIDEKKLDRLIWRTRSLQKDLYKQASIGFTGFDEEEKTIERTLIRSDYLEGPYWYQPLGSERIIASPNILEYEFEDSANEGLKRADPQPEYQELLDFWLSCLRNTFGSHGATMWVSQPHSESFNSRIVSSVFALFNEPIVDPTVRYGAAKRLRDFIIDYLIGIYKIRVEAQYKVIERDYERLLAGESSRIYISSIVDRRLKFLAPVICSGVTILITGETGTGKNVIARKIHELSGRQNGPFQVITCSQYVDQPDAFRALLFEKNSTFLGENSNGSVVFDDVHACTSRMQLDLKELLDRRASPSLITDASSSLGCRLLFTAGPDLHEAVLNGVFSDDLYYRINTFEVALPSLRSRKADLQQISEAILRELLLRYPVAQKKILTAEALKELQGYDFPGNYRELYNILIRAFLLSPVSQSSIEVRHIKI